MSIAELLPDTALERIDTLVAAVDRAEASAIDYSDTVSVFFLRNFTIEPIEPFLKFHLMREALCPALTFGGYDSALQDVLDPDSPLHSADKPPDIIVLALELSQLDQDFISGADRAIERLLQTFDAVRENTAALLVVNTMLPVVLGADGVVAPEPDVRVEIERVNAEIERYAATHAQRIAIVDWARVVVDLGADASIDSRFWRTGMAPFSAAFLEVLARRLTRIACALKGRAKKCLVLDCDDTLWGGVIGEDGPGGIRLGPPDGDAYCAFQQSVVALQERGVIIALCSKNNAEDVWQVLDEHPDSVLKRAHLSAWRINWDDKASNLLALGAELNLGLDSFVFVDDSPRECQLIRDALPQVTVLQVPDSLEGYADLIVRDGLFDTLAVSDEDQRRSALYQEQQVRAQNRGAFAGVDDYLASLGQVLSIWPGGVDDVTRIAQLTQKTNQFNLTTQRYSEGQIASFIQDSNCAVFTMAVSDRYGDLGKTGVLIARRDGKVGVVDSLLLSCRILGRKLEYAFVDRCLARLEQDWGVRDWHATFVPTRKNAQVADFWDRVGFSPDSDTDTMKSYRRQAGFRLDNYRDVMSIEEA